MGSRLALSLLLLAALAASVLFWWLSSREPTRTGPAGAAPTEERAAESVEPAPAELAPATTVDPTPAPRAVDRTVVDEPRVAGASRSKRSRGDVPRIRGAVVDRVGDPVVGAIVLATNQTGFPLDIDPGTTPWARRWETTSDADGRFELVGPSAGELRLAVRAPGFAPYERRDLSIPSDPEVELAPIVMSLGAILSGHVLDPDGRGVAGAELVRIGDADHGGLVILGGRREPVAVTGADGSFRIDQLACGSWKLLVHAEDHPDRTFEGLAERPGEEVFGLEFVLAPGTTITGRVADVPEDERAKLVVRAAKVRDEGWLSPFRARTADVEPAGRFTLRGLEIGTDYDLRLRRAEEEGVSYGFFGRSRSETVRARAGDTGIVIPYQPEGALVFHVLDANTLQPLTDLEVEAGTGWAMPLRDEDGTPRTFFPDGLVRVGDLRPGGDDERVQLVVRATGYREFRRDDIVLVTGQEIDLGPIHLEPVPVVRVTVLDAHTGEPLSGVLVMLDEEQPPNEMRFTRTIEIDGNDGVTTHISSGGMMARTDENGVAELTSLEGRTCALRVRSEDHAPFDQGGLFLPFGRIVEQTVELTPGGEVLVTVRDPDGQPLPGARVSHRVPGQAGGPFFHSRHGGGSEVTDSDGRLRFENLEPGVHAFKLDEGNSFGGMWLTGAGDVHVNIDGTSPVEDDWSEVEVVEGGTAELTLQASPHGGLVGRVREAGIVLAGATLRLTEKTEKGGEDRSRRRMMPMMGGGNNTRSDGEGEYAFDDVKQGVYTLSVSHPTRRMSGVYEVEIKPSQNTFDVDLPVSVIEGRITDPEGVPLSGLSVRAERAQGDGERATFFALRIESDGDDTVVSTGPELGDAATTDADGRYVLRGVQPDVDLVVTAEGDAVQENRSKVLRVAPDEVRSGVDLTLEAAGTIEVEALLADGAPASFCVVRATYLGDDAGVQPEFSFIQSGTARLTGLRPGPWRVNVQKAGPGRDDQDPGVDREVEVVGGETAQTTIHLD